MNATFLFCCCCRCSRIRSWKLSADNEAGAISLNNIVILQENPPCLTAICCIFIAYSFLCYQCIRKEAGEGEYSKEECEKDQKIVNCTNPDPTDSEDYTCVSFNSESEDGKEYVMKACYLKRVCEEKKKECEDKKKLKELKVKECSVTCCVSEGDTPCNSGFTMSTNVIMTTLSVLCSMKLF